MRCIARQSRRRLFEGPDPDLKRINQCVHESWAASARSAREPAPDDICCRHPCLAQEEPKPMPVIREPVFKPVPLADLRPTQITIGLREVEERRKRWRARKGKGAGTFFATHLIPVVLGPGERHYVIDHHHLARALLDEGLTDIYVTVVARLEMLSQDAFWVFLDNRGWLHPFDSKGRRCTYKDIPKAIRDLEDDPFRSLAGALRRAGGCSKETTPFNEFLWADFLRRRMKRQTVKHHFDEALRKALVLVKTKDAEFLPGWCGPADDP
jgi:hypothetical protein